MLPDKSEEFSIVGYRNYLDPQKRFDRLRLYLCDKGKLRWNNLSTITIHVYCDGQLSFGASTTSLWLELHLLILNVKITSFNLAKVDM